MRLPSGVQFVSRWATARPSGRRWPRANQCRWHMVRPMPNVLTLASCNSARVGSLVHDARDDAWRGPAVVEADLLCSEASGPGDLAHTSMEYSIVRVCLHSHGDCAMIIMAHDGNFPSWEVRGCFPIQHCTCCLAGSKTTRPEPGWR